MKTRLTAATLFRLGLLVAWVVLFAMLLERDYFVKSLELHEARIIEQGREQSFLGVYFNNERIGFVKNRLTRSADNETTLSQDAYLRLNILNEIHPIRLHITAGLTEQLLLKHFVFNLVSPFYRMEAQGEVKGRDVHLTLITGKETITDVVRLKSPPFLSTNQRGYLLRQGLKEGDKIKIPYFDPVSLSGKDTIMEYKGLEKKLVQGRIYRLHHFVEIFSGVRINSWLDEEGKVVQEESPAGFVFIAEPEFKATDIPDPGREILSAVSVPLIGSMPGLAGLSAIRYRLTLPQDGEFSLNKDRQTLDNDMLTVSLEALPPATASACDGPEKYLAATPYIQSTNRVISDHGRSLTKNSHTDLARVRVLADWVYRNLEKRPVLGIPDALTTLHTRRGDCNEHAALFAGLARSVGIPTRVAAGVTFHEGAFYYHAWNEVCLDGNWLSLDTTKNQLPADITHIKFVDGETSEQIKISALLGKLRIEVVNEEDQLATSGN